jgi:hypothetical protein
MITMTLENALLPLLLFAIAGLGALAIKLYKEGTARVGDWSYILENGAKIAVLAAEQLFKSGEGEAKLRYAEKFVYEYLDNYGITFTDEQKGIVRGAIEAAVYELTREIVE